MSAGLKHFQITVSTVTALKPGATTSGRAPGGLVVKALAANTAAVYIGGDSTVTSATGFPLAAGESVSLNVDDPARVFAIAASGSQGLAVLYV